MEEAAARRNRLKALRERATTDSVGDGAEAEAPVLRFRNYAPRDEKGISHEKVPAIHRPGLRPPKPRLVETSACVLIEETYFPAGLCLGGAGACPDSGGAT
jgi:hypothetical protein